MTPIPTAQLHIDLADAQAVCDQLHIALHMVNFADHLLAASVFAIFSMNIALAEHLTPIFSAIKKSNSGHF